MFTEKRKRTYEGKFLNIISVIPLNIISVSFFIIFAILRAFLTQRYKISRHTGVNNAQCLKPLRRILCLWVRTRR